MHCHILHIYFTERVPRQRPFAMNFDTGSPNLIVTEPGILM